MFQMWQDRINSSQLRPWGAFLPYPCWIRKRQKRSKDCKNDQIPVPKASHDLREHFCLIPVAVGKSKNLRKCSKDGKNARIQVPMTSYALREHFRLISVAFGKSKNLRKFAQMSFKMLQLPNNAYIWQNSGLPYRKHVQKGQIWGKTLEFQF